MPGLRPGISSVDAITRFADMASRRPSFAIDTVQLTLYKHIILTLYMFAVGVSSPLIDDRFVIHQVEDAPKKLDCGPGFTLCAIFHNHIGMTATKVANMTEKFLLRKHACIAQPCPNFNGLGKDLFRNCYSGISEARVEIPNLY